MKMILSGGRIFLAAGLCLSVCQFNAQAQTNHNKKDPAKVIDNDSTHALGEIVVTAGRTRQYRKNVPQKIEVITSKDIAATPALDLADILKKTAAVNTIQYPGLLSGVGFRGFRPQFSGLNQHTLILVNGHPAGATNLGLIDLTNVDRIEVLKGPASALYGSQAMGGVVNIIPLQSSGAVKGNVFADYGSFNTYQFGGQAGGNITRKLDFDLAATYFARTSDFRIGDGNLFRNMFGSDKARNVYSNGKDTLVNDKRADGAKRPNTEYKYFTSSGRLGYQLSQRWRLDLSGTVFKANHVESPGDIFSGEAGAASKNVQRHSTDLGLTGKAGIHELSARAYYADERSTYFAIRNATGAPIDTPYVSSKSKYGWYGLQLRDVMSFGKQKLIVGYDFNHAASESLSFSKPAAGKQKETTSSPNAALITNGVYVQGQFTFLQDRLKINPGVRFDLTDFAIKHTPYYTQTLFAANQRNTFISPSLAAQYNILPALAVHGSIGRAFVTPDPSNVAGYSVSGAGTGKVAISRGNPDLKNESSVSEEIGVKYDDVKTGLQADVTYFNTNVKDRVASVSAPPAAPDTLNGDVVTAVTTFYNANKSNMQGLEVMASYDFGSLAAYRYSLRLFTNMTYFTKAEDYTIAATGKRTTTQVQNVAKRTITYGMEYARGHFSTRLTGRYVGKRWDTDFNDPLRPLVQYSSFMTLDYTASYTFLQRHKISFTLANLTDENYYEKRGYNMPGRNFRVRYTWSFGKDAKK